jgi:hypothetical protein
LAAISVETVRVELKNPVLAVIVEIATVDAMRDDPVSVENWFSAKLDTLILAAISVETVSVEVMNPVLAVIVEIATVDAMRDEPVSVEN